MYMLMQCDEAIFAWFQCSSGLPSLALVAYHLEVGEGG